FPDHDAVINGGTATSFQEFWRKIVAVGSCYRRWNVSTGDRVILVLPNGLDFLLLHFAALKIGAISVPLKNEYKWWELNPIIAECRPHLLVSDDAWLNENLHALELPAETRVASVDHLSHGSCDDCDAPSVLSSQALASINYTYTGDGQHKGAMLTHANHLYAATGYARHQGFTAQDKFLIILPMSHVFALSGCVNSGLIRGSTLVIQNNLAPKAILGAIEKHRITILSAVPCVFEYLARFSRRDRYDLSSLRLCVTGGDYMPADLHHECEKEFGAQIVQGYGLTESLPIICNPPGPRNQPGTLGIPGRRDIEIRIVDKDSQELSSGEMGEIIIRSPTTMSGYYQRPHDTQKTLRGGWLYTGDWGKLDDDGFLHFCGVKKNVFNLNGNKVDPLEVSRALLEHPMVDDVEIYAETSEGTRAQQICARVVVKEAGEELSSSELREFWKTRIAGYKIPKKISVLSKAARTGTQGPLYKGV
ncbi:MAG: class I adenylate-forming enzyme family protein, partial [Nitrospirales bacterium]